MLLHQVLSSLAAAYFLNKNMRFLTVLNCWKANENVHLHKELASNEMVINTFDMSHPGIVDRVVHDLMSHHFSKIGVFLQSDCVESFNIIRACSVEKCFSQKFYWLIYSGNDQNPNQNDTLMELGQTNLHVDSEITYFDIDRSSINETTAEIPLYDVYNNGYHAGGLLRVNYDRLFHYDATHEQSVLEKSPNDLTPKYVRRMNLSDLTFRVGTVYQINDNRVLTTDSILEHLNSVNNSQFDVLNRPTFQMAMHVQELLGYKADWQHRPIWGLNDTHGGALGDIIAGNTDIAYVLAGLNMNRLAYMHVILETRNFRSVFLFRTFGSQKSGLIENVFFKPFHTSVWCSLAVCVALLSVGLHAIHRGELHNRLANLPFLPSAMLSVVTAVGAFCQQGAFVVPATLNGRFLMLVLYVASILTYTYYTTEVLSALIGSPVQTNIRTLGQLALSSLTVGLENVSHTITYLNVSCRYGYQLVLNDCLSQITVTPDLQLLKERKLNTVRNASQLWTPLAEGLDRVRRGGHAYHCEDTHAYAYIRRTFEPVEMCDINEVYLRAKLQVGYMSNKQSPYLELFKTKFRKLRETGILSKYNRKWMPAKPPCLVDSFVLSVGMEYAGPLFMFLACAMVLCWVILLVEWVDFRVRSKWQRPKSGEWALEYGYQS